MECSVDGNLPSQVYQLELFPESSVTLAMFQDVKNVAELKNKLVNQEIDAVLLTPSMLVSSFHILVAVNKALDLHVRAVGHAKTKTVNSEIIYSLSPSRNISDSFKTFAMGVGDKAIVVVILNDQDNSKLKAVSQQIEGTCVPLDQLSRYSDEEAIMKKYEIKKAELSIGSLEDAVVCKMAAKDVS